MNPSQRRDDQQSSSDFDQPSPRDTRDSITRGESSTGRDGVSFSDTLQPGDVVRRRPEGYGSIQHGSAPSSSPNIDQQSRSGPSVGAPMSPVPHRTKSYSRLRKPPMSRRTSSHTPHRGGIFSCEDEPAEVEADQIERQRDFGTRRRTQLPRSLSRAQSIRSERELELEAEETPPEEDEEEEETSNSKQDDEDASSEVSEAESFTLKDRQAAINHSHPFGIRVWKPALYKKDRSIQKSAETDIHSTPGGRVSKWLLLFNLMWTIIFGWWLAMLAAFGAIVCLLFTAVPSGREYGRVLWGLAGYLFYPFGKFVRLEKDEAYLEEDQDEGRSISEYEQWQSGDLEYGRLFFGPDRSRSIVGRSRRSMDSAASETESLLGRRRRGEGDLPPRMKRRLFGRGEWNIGRVIFFVFFYCLISPSLILVSAICWFLVFAIPMGKVTILLFDHLRRHPLAISFEPDVSYSRSDGAPDSSILLCTYRAVGTKYWKYTVDGTNIFLINLMAVVIFVIFDWLVFDQVLHLDSFITSPAFLFTASLLSIIPLAYFIGQAVASISAQSSMGVGAVINAFFATIVEVFLYCIALTQGKSSLVEGSIVGSIFAGILFLPGLSMCFGALKRKTQRFNARSAGVTSTMLLFAVVGAFGPTLFYQIYGTHELSCFGCDDHGNMGGGGMRDCQRCYFSQAPALDDRFYLEAVRPYCYMAATMLFLSYLIGLWFTLRTHAAVIWNTEVDEKKHEDHMNASTTLRTPQLSIAAESTSIDVHDSPMYKRILGQSLKQVGLSHRPEDSFHQSSTGAQDGPKTPSTLHAVPPKFGAENSGLKIRVPGLSEADNQTIVREVTEIAATAATLAQRERMTRRASSYAQAVPSHRSSHAARPAGAIPDEEDAAQQHASGVDHGGHDAPNWSRVKSAVILLGATVLYAIIAEILVDTVDVVLESFAIDQKFLGVTLFALVPNTTEFLNAISFAMNGNIALSMEIGSAYALQVCLLQIPCLVLFSALFTVAPAGADDPGQYTFSLLFPQWDMVTVILCVFLLSYVYGEGKSNYFKGSILCLTYLVVIVGYYFSGFAGNTMGLERFDLMKNGEWRSYKTIGRSANGQAFQV